MSDKIDMTRLMESELRKVRDYPRYKFHSFVFVNEVDEARKRLKIAGIRFTTKPVQRNNEIVGYKIYTES